jgi:hypothetical protein
MTQPSDSKARLHSTEKLFCESLAILYTQIICFLQSTRVGVINGFRETQAQFICAVPETKLPQASAAAPGKDCIFELQTISSVWSSTVNDLSGACCFNGVTDSVAAVRAYEPGLRKSFAPAVRMNPESQPRSPGQTRAHPTGLPIFQPARTSSPR